MLVCGSKLGPFHLPLYQRVLHLIFYRQSFSDFDIFKLKNRFQRKFIIFFKSTFSFTQIHLFITRMVFLIVTTSIFEIKMLTGFELIRFSNYKCHPGNICQKYFLSEVDITKLISVPESLEKVLNIIIPISTGPESGPRTTKKNVALVIKRPFYTLETQKFSGTSATSPD